MIIYGTKQCPDTQACLDAFESKGRAVEFRCIENLPFLKEFLHYRDNDAAFDPVKANGGVGIPLIVKDDGSLTFDWEPLL